MSTQESIWLGEYNGKSVHIYWELADRDIDLARKLGKTAAPVYIAADQGNADDEIAMRLPKTVAEQLLEVLLPNWHEHHHVL